MLPLSNTTWDLQFQKDFELPSTALNIGWFFARASDATKEFFYRSYQQWLVTKGWDQAVMNEVAYQMEGANTLKVHRLDLARFRNYMLEDPEVVFFGPETKTARFLSASAIVHYTCVETALKNYFGSTFGGSTDFNGYYSAPPLMLAVANITGTTRSVVQQIALALEIAKDTGRALIWPHSVTLIQQRPVGGIIKHFVHEYFPGVRVVNYARAQKLGVELLESRFLHNQLRNVPDATSRQVLFSMSKQLLLSDGNDGQNSMDHLKTVMASQPPHVVPTLDFSNFHSLDYPWLRSIDAQDAPWYEVSSLDHNEYIEQASAKFNAALQEAGIEEYSADTLSRLQMCGNADWDADCLGVCKD
jgi:hypothetical protein